MNQNETLRNPRVIVVQKLYAQEFNKESKLTFPKHRYKKFIKDVVLGTLERKELIEETIKQHLSEDLSIKRTEKLLIMILRIRPMKIGEYFEPCLLEFQSESGGGGFYPSAIVHIDTFWQGQSGDNEVYNMLSEGTVVDVEIDLKLHQAREGKEK